MAEWEKIRWIINVGNIFVKQWCNSYVCVFVYRLKTLNTPDSTYEVTINAVKQPIQSEKLLLTLWSWIPSWWSTKTQVLAAVHFILSVSPPTPAAKE